MAQQGKVAQRKKEGQETANKQKRINEGTNENEAAQTKDVIAQPYLDMRHLQQHPASHLAVRACTNT